MPNIHRHIHYMGYSTRRGRHGELGVVVGVLEPWPYSPSRGERLAGSRRSLG